VLCEAHADIRLYTHHATISVAGRPIGAGLSTLALAGTMSVYRMTSGEPDIARPSIAVQAWLGRLEQIQFVPPPPGLGA